jgi:hypothetical protein
MYFYLLSGPTRVGFGVTSNVERRQKDYTGAWGYPAEFGAVWTGTEAHVKHFEYIIKVQHRDLLWQQGRWTTEWFDNGWTLQEAAEWVEQQLAYTHVPLERVT